MQIKYMSEERVQNLRHLTECHLYLYELIEGKSLISTAKGHKIYGY